MNKAYLSLKIVFWFRKSVKTIVSTSESKENVTIEYSHAVINGSLPTTVAQVEFIASENGLRQICLNASDEYVTFLNTLSLSFDIHVFSVSFWH